MLTLFKLANRNFSQAAARTIALRAESTGTQSNLSNLCARPFATARNSTLDKKKQIEEDLEKFENEDFGLDWSKLSSYDKETSKEYLEELSQKLEESVISSEQKAEAENARLQKRLGNNFSKYRGKVYQERHPGFPDHIAPLPRKFNLYDQANSVQIWESQDYAKPLDSFSKTLTELTYVDHLNGKFQKDWDTKYQDITHYNQLMPELKNEDYLKGKPRNFLVIHNIPKTASRLSLLKLVKQFGEIKEFQIRENLAGENAFVEVHYANASDASKAKKELYRKKFQGASLYPMNVDDAPREHPNRRTLAIYNLDQSWNEQKAVFELSKYGNIMDIQLPLQFRHGKLPTHSEVIKVINGMGLNSEERARIRIKEFVYEEKGYGIISFDVKVHSMPNQSFYSDKVDSNVDTAESFATKEAGDVYGRIVDQIKADDEKFYNEEIAGAFPIYYCCADYSKIQHLLEAPSVDSNYTADQELLRLSFTEGEIRRFQQSLFKVEQRNRGYCFVTFASEDDAKRALVNFTYRPLLNTKLAGTLKLDTNHVDWDAQKFNELMDTHDVKERVRKEKLKSEAKKLKNQKESAELTKNFHNSVFEDQVEKGYLDVQVPKYDLKELELAPENFRAKYTRQQQSIQHSYKDNQLYQTLKDELINDTDRFQPNLDEEEATDSRLEVGRNFNSKITKGEYKDLVEKLANRTMTSKHELSDTAKEYFDEMDKLRLSRALDDLIQLNKALAQQEKVPASEQLAHIEKKLEELKEKSYLTPQQERFVDDMIHVMPARGVDKEAEYDEYLRKKTILDARNKKRKRTLFGSGAKFSTVKELEARVSAKGPTSEEVTKRALVHLEEIATKIHTGKLTEADFEELYRPRLENFRNNISQDPHFLVRDQRGLQFVTEEDLKRFEEDETPENPEELASFKEEKKNLKMAKLRRDKEREEKLRNPIPSSAYVPVSIALLRQGIPLESFEFKPSAEYKTIEKYIEQLNSLDEIYTYVKEKDEKGKDVILKLFKRKYKYDLDRLMNIEPANISSDLRSIFEANGISVSQSESGDPEYETLQRIVAEKNPSPKEKAAIEAVREKYPEILEMAITGESPIDNDLFMRELLEQISNLKLEESTKALSKDDLVKYRSNLLNVKDEEGKLSRSKYRKI